MNISGLDYNTQREHLILPEYGREVQQMVDYCCSLPTRAERQRCANTIITVMERMAPRMGDRREFRHKLWDHLAIISGFRLDIDWPVDISEARRILAKPESMTYPMKRIPVRHYGGLMFEVFDLLKHMPDSPQRKELIRLAANQMKRDLMQWGHGSSDNERVAADLERFTDGTVRLNLNTFKFDRTPTRNLDKKQRRRR